VRQQQHGHPQQQWCFGERQLLLSHVRQQDVANSFSGQQEPVGVQAPQAAVPC
jgi:hypothetical protein